MSRGSVFGSGELYDRGKDEKAFTEKSLGEWVAG